MKKYPYLSIVIPAYNEEKRILESLKSITDYFKKRSTTYEVIVVSDGSTDKTAFIVNKYAGINPNIRLESYENNRGKGYAVKYGMKRAVGDFLLFIDGDGAIDISHLDKFLKYIGKGYDIVIGSIELEGHVAKDNNEWYRRILSKMSKLLVRVLATPGIHDTQRAFKLFSRQAGREIFNRQTIDRWGFDIELLVIARQHGYKIKEIPVTWINPDGSKQEGIKTYINTLLELFEIVYKSLVGYYRPAGHRFLLKPKESS